jgi:hypothetical protein
VDDAHFTQDFIENIDKATEKGIRLDVQPGGPRFDALASDSGEQPRELAPLNAFAAVHIRGHPEHPRKRGFVMCHDTLSPTIQVMGDRFGSSPTC